MSIPRRWQNTLCHNCQWFNAWQIDDDWEWECSHPDDDYAWDIFTPKFSHESCQGFEQRSEQ